MVGTDNSQPDFEHFPWQRHNFDPMNASREIKQQESLQTYIKSGNCLFSTCVGMQGFGIPPSLSFKVEQKNDVHGSHQCLLSPHFQNSLSTPRPHQKENDSLHYPAPSGMPVPKSNNGSYSKGFLIFDQSGNQKRLMYASMCHPVYIPPTVAVNHGHPDGLEEEWASGDINSVKYFPNALSNEKYVTGEESEMHEDTEEIDALLYSDDDSTGCSSDDEVTSTGHSPELINECYGKEEEEWQEITTEVASSDGPRKRQRVHDRGAIESLPITTVACAKLEPQKFANDAESSCGMGHEEEAGMDIGFCISSSKKDRIRETLRVLERFVPGAKGKDPLLIIDEAIDYLKSLKHEASALGVSCY